MLRVQLVTKGMLPTNPFGGADAGIAMKSFFPLSPAIVSRGGRFTTGENGLLFQDPFDVRLQEGLDVDPDDDVVADDGAAVFQFAVPTDLKILAIDAGLGDETDTCDGSGVAGIGPIRRFPLADVVHVQIDRP